MRKYDDIINLPHHVSQYYEPIPMEIRASQFASFEALNGHDDALAETARLTDILLELTSDEKTTISCKLDYAMACALRVRISFFCPDGAKEGGAYKILAGYINKWDEYDNTLLMQDGSIIQIDYISGIEVGDDTED